MELYIVFYNFTEQFITWAIDLYKYIF